MIGFLFWGALAAAAAGGIFEFSNAGRSRAAIACLGLLLLSALAAGDSAERALGGDRLALAE